VCTLSDGFQRGNPVALADGERYETNVGVRV
jgi:hypothetical protein